MSLLSWTDQLPEDWEAKPLRSVADYVVSNVDKVSNDDEIPVRLCNYTDVYNNEFITLALDFMLGTASEAEITNFGLKPSDVIITKDSESWNDIGVPALVHETADNLVCGYHLALLRPLEQKMDGAFLFRCIQAEPVRKQLELAANGVTRFGIPKARIGTLMLPVPPLAQQRVIAAYLDHETARLDALAAAKERVLRLLAEKRRALITRAVTRGLDPRVPLRDTGIPWLGEIPAHWSRMQLRRFAHFVTSGSRGWAEHYSDTGSLFVRIGNLTRDSIHLDLTEAQYVEPPEGSEGERTKIQPGDLLFSITAYLGSIAVAPVGLGKAYINQHIALVRLGNAKGLDPVYAGYTSLSDVGQSQLVGQGYGGTKTQLALDDIRELWFPVPPLHEQMAIIRRIEREISAIDELCSSTRRTIALLRERRVALISAAITGQLEVA